MKRMICVLCMIMLVSISYTAYGAVIDSVDFDMDDTQIITVSGTLDYGYNNRLLGITVEYPDQIAVSGDFISAFAHIGQTVVNFDGTYLYKFQMSGQSGLYKISVTDGNQSGTTQFQYVDENAITSFMNAIDNDVNYDGIKDKEDIRITLENNQDVSIRSKISQYYNFPEKDLIVSELNNNRPYNNSFTKLENVINNTVILYELNNAQTVDSLIIVLNEYQSDIKLNYENSVYKNADENAKKSILQTLLSVDFTKVSDINKKFEEICFSKAIKEADFWQTVEFSLKENAAHIGINFNDYDGLSDKSAVCEKFIGKSMTFEEAKILFDNAVYAEKQKEEQQNSFLGNTSGNGSGGGKSSGGGMAFKDTTTLPQSYKHSFTDVGNVLWAENALNYLSEKNIIAGVEPGKFQPMAMVTREQFVKMIVHALGKENNTFDVNFSDVKKNDWHYRYIATAVNLGIVNGQSHDLFGVGKNITRQDMAVLVYRAISRFNEISKNNKSNFADEKFIDSYALEAVYALKEATIINGKDNNEFKPKETATRAEAAQIIYNMMKYLGY